MEYIIVVGYTEMIASLISFLSSFRIFWVIFFTGELRKMDSYQIMALIAFMECWQMSATLLGGLMVVMQSTINEILYTIVANVAITSWMTLLVLRFCLSLNRFTVLTRLSHARFLKRPYFHRLLLVFPVLVLLSTLTLCIIYKHPFVMVIELGGWNFLESTPIRPMESFFSNGMSFSAFAVYVATFTYIIKIKKQTNTRADLGEIRILISSALAFSYEMCMIILFHCIFPFIDVPAWSIGVIGILWSFLPGFNGIMLLAINRSFRARFFHHKNSNVPSIFVSVVHRHS
ncbi:hypothetical protein QR680_016400 [Steinernema hermaphroditum]|uniref:Uncharacterized protein n=1 Tax=Steinernema hermaphroditum TaxID=289476 RepID=A0AA39LLY0_9BILA|nr:hypothetical protein QR680_016400 [Steinernema hermaphroditum]